MEAAMSDPCGIVDTIQSNMNKFRSIANEPADAVVETETTPEGEPSAPTETSGETSTSSSPNTPSEKPAGRDGVEDDDTENDTESPTNDTKTFGTNDSNSYSNSNSNSNNRINDNDDDSSSSNNNSSSISNSAASKTQRKKEKGGILLGWGYPREEKKSDESFATSESTENGNQQPPEPPKMAAVSDLSDPSRKIYVVTTASLPWRTGTAVNPLARALYLTRGRPKNAVTLMIPWLESLEEQAKLYGANVFETPEEQETWVRNYARESILTDTADHRGRQGGGDRDGDRDAGGGGDGDEVDNLHICFYPAKYHTLLGSIFATVDICALIPHEEADVAILEEPEHLTWFRTLPRSSRSSSSSSNNNKHGWGTSSGAETPSAMSSIMDHDQTCSACAATGSDLEQQQQQQQQAKEDPSGPLTNSGDNKNGNDDDDDDEYNGTGDYESDEDDRRKMEEMAIIGWTAKFNYVVGILHTNYSAYMRQYGLGASIVTASALQALSTVCVRAYTHRLVRLSDTLPELDRPKEVTCNVHGVRPEFFVEHSNTEEPANNGNPVTAAAAAATATESIEAANSLLEKDDSDATTEETPPSSRALFCETMGEESTDDGENDEQFRPEPIYFIGKVIWAKGFDKLLEIEDLYRKETGEYFPIDVYGSGGDFDAIARAFIGRSGLAKKISSSGSIISLEGGRNSREGSKSPVPTSGNTTNGANTNTDTSQPPSPQDQTAALLFSREGNLRGMIEEGQTIPSNELVVEVQTHENIPATADDSSTSNINCYGRTNPKRVMTHLSVKTVETTSSVTKAIAALSGKISQLGFRSLYSEESDEEDGDTTSASGSIASKFRFDPPKSRYELRRHSIPARFLGVKDHAVLRDVKGHKIFINLSITEVLCTTTAEAMAMERFVIIPNHPSNTFFLQFPNCLAYESKNECVEHIKFALTNDPTPLSPEDRHKLTWEGANIRLFESSLITEEEADEMNNKTADFARLHIDTMKTGAFFQGLWARGAKTYRKERREEQTEEERQEADDNEVNATGFCKISKPQMLDCL